jgi:hypothetical protein
MIFYNFSWAKKLKKLQQQYVLLASLTSELLG